MSAKYDVDMDVEVLETSDPFDYYTKVIIVAGETEDGENIMGTAGDDSGKTLEVHIPLFSAPAGQSESVFALADALAADILNQLKEYEYQPFDARGVIAPLEATLGDGIVINDIYGAINKQQIEFHPLVTFDYSSDSADDDDNEFGITKKSEAERLLEGFVRYASTIEMHANSILAEVRSNAGAISKIEQKVDEQGSSIEMVVSDGQVNASAIIQAINGESSATINADRINLTAQVIKNTGVMTWNNITNKPSDLVYTSDLTGYVTDDELSNYVTDDDLDSRISTTIDDMSITAEQLRGSEVQLIVPYGTNRYYTAGALSLTGASSYSGRKIVMDSGAIELAAVYGAIYLNAAQYVGTSCELQVGGDCYPSSNGNYDLGTSSFKWSDIYATNSTIHTSDRNKKKDIRPLDDLVRYDDLYDLLEPVVYKFIDGTSGRDHIGFIAQDVEEALSKSGLSTTEFAGFVRGKDKDGKDIYGLRYGEFIALNTHRIKQLEKRIDKLEKAQNPSLG